MSTPAIKLLDERLRAAGRNLTWLMDERQRYQDKVTDLNIRIETKLSEIEDLEEAIRALSYPKGGGS